MAEEQQQSPGAAQQPNDNSLNEPSIGMMYDKEKDQAKVFSQNPDGSIGTVDPVSYTHLVYPKDLTLRRR